MQETKLLSCSVMLFSSFSDILLRDGYMTKTCFIHNSFSTFKNIEKKPSKQNNKQNTLFIKRDYNILNFLWRHLASGLFFSGMIIIISFKMTKGKTSYSSATYWPILNSSEKHSKNGFLVKWHTYLTLY